MAWRHGDRSRLSCAACYELPYRHVCTPCAGTGTLSGNASACAWGIVASIVCAHTLPRLGAPDAGAVVGQGPQARIGHILQVKGRLRVVHAILAAAVAWRREVAGERRESRRSAFAQGRMRAHGTMHAVLAAAVAWSNERAPASSGVGKDSCNFEVH